MIGAEHQYNQVKKEYISLVFTIQKMQHYLVGPTIQVILKVNPLRLLMTGPDGQIVAGVGVVLEYHQKHIISHAFSLIEPYSNNIEEYDVLLIGLKVTKYVRAKDLESLR